MIRCNENTVTDTYINYTTNLSQRKYRHKQECQNLKNIMLLYTVIRENGGWDNWRVEVLQTRSFDTMEDAEKRTMYFINMYKPTLNQLDVFDLHNGVIHKALTCPCGKSYAHYSSFYRHNLTCKYNNSKPIKNEPKIKPSYRGLFGAYYSCSSDDDDDQDQQDQPNEQDEPEIIMHDSNKRRGRPPYQTHVPPVNTKVSNNPRTSFSTTQIPQSQRSASASLPSLPTFPSDDKTTMLTDLVFELLDQNKTLQKQMIELSKERNIIVNNTNNTQFNLNVFLNEECKDAINLSDFVNSLEITLDDLAVTKNEGLVESISNVMINGLKQMDIYKRPIHCTDQKRDTIYIKDNHIWAKDDGNRRIRQAFVDIANKEYKAIKMWMDAHPEWETNPRLQDAHHQMMKNVLHEIQDDHIGERRILKALERETFLEK